MNEAELLARIKQNPSDFSELFKLYYKPIFGYILRRTGDFDSTADIAADTFLKAFNAIPHFTYKGISIKIWLYRIATNEMNQFFRQRKKHNFLFEKLDIENRNIFHNLLANDKKELEAEMQRHEMFLAVQRELKLLPTKYQAVIALRYFEGKDNREIAEILNMNEGTLKSLLSRGLKKLREKCNQI